MRIVAIGGGEIGRPRGDGKGNYPIETLSIDREIVRLAGKKHPKLLFLPTASGDHPGYFPVIEKYFGKRLGCDVSALYLETKKYSEKTLREMVMGADIIYVGGGNTLSMIRTWKRLGFDKVLREAVDRDIVLSGVSAGAVCWFKYANSDSRKKADGTGELSKIKCLNFLDLFTCPHYDAELGRPESLKKMVYESGDSALALDNCTAIEIINDQFRILSSRRNANAYLLNREGKKVVQRRIKKNKFQTISQLKR